MSAQGWGWIVFHDGETVGRGVHQGRASRARLVKVKISLSVTERDGAADD